MPAMIAQASMPPMLFDALNGASLESNYDFYAISAAKTADLKIRSEYQAFNRDLPRIASSLRLPRSTAREGEVFTGSDRLLSLRQEGFIDLINRAYRAGLERRGDLSQAILNPGEYPTALQEYVTDYLEGRGVDLKAIREHGIQLFGEGWTSQKDPQYINQWKVTIYTERQDLQTYVEKLKVFVEFDGPRGSLMAESISETEADEIIKTIEETFKLQAGQMESLSFSRLLGDASRDLPVNSQLLALTGAELKRLLTSPRKEDRERRKRELQHCALCYRVLDAFLQKKKFDFVKDAKGKLIEVRQRTSDADVLYWDDTRTPFSYTWIPADFFP